MGSIQYGFPYRTAQVTKAIPQYTNKAVALIASVAFGSGLLVAFTIWYGIG